MAKKKTTTKKKKAPSKRRAGKPHARERAIGPEQLEVISRQWCKGRPNSETAETLGVDPKTISYHLKQTIFPLWRQKVTRGLDYELGKIDHLETIAWEHFESDAPSESRETVEEALLEASHGSPGALTVVKRATSRLRKLGQTAWLDVVEWCISERSKLLGLYAAKEYRMSQEHTFRVAGSSPAELDEAMLARVGVIVSRRRELETARRIVDN